MTDFSQHLPRRPRSLWIFCLIITLLAVYNVLLALDQLTRAGYYRDLGVSYPPLLRAGLALAWGVALLVVAGGLFRRRRWARRWTLIVLSNYGAFNVLWLVIFARSDFSRGRLAFEALLTLALVTLAGWVLRWRRIRAAFDAPDPA
jgi:hypothetical protein